MIDDLTSRPAVPAPGAPIPFNRPFIAGKELYYIARAVQSGHLSGDGEFTRRCREFLERTTGARRVLLTGSCTAALELAALLCELQPGDEFILPSYTFVSTANAFALRGGVPVFVDIRPDTLNLDEELIERAITPRTRVIVPVHYAGVGCAMERIMAIADRHGLLVVEDAAQGVDACYRGRALGTWGQLGCYSFHETKNFIAGEGGALLVNDERFRERAEILREKGTNRSAFYRGEVDKYTWVDLGSSYLPGELTAAFLFAQLEQAAEISARRRALWETYHRELAELEADGLLRRPVIPAECRANAHMYYLLLRTPAERDGLLRHLQSKGIQAVFHYVPLHSSPQGRKLGRTPYPLPVTEALAARLLRLPAYYELEPEQIHRIVGEIRGFFGRAGRMAEEARGSGAADLI